jgi:hypothetical protein
MIAQNYVGCDISKQRVWGSPTLSLPHPTASGSVTNVVSGLS